LLIQLDDEAKPCRLAGLDAPGELKISWPFCASSSLLLRVIHPQNSYVVVAIRCLLSSCQVCGEAAGMAPVDMASTNDRYNDIVIGTPIEEYHTGCGEITESVLVIGADLSIYCIAGAEMM